MHSRVELAKRNHRYKDPLQVDSLPYVQMHEFEGLLMFSEPNPLAFADSIGRPDFATAILAADTAERL